MNITCWNCKTVTTLDKIAVEAALTAMDASKLGFHDIVCASCGKSNRTARDAFVAGLATFESAPSASAAAPSLSKREINQQAKDEKAKRDKEKKEKVAVKELVKKSKKGK